MLLAGKAAELKAKYVVHKQERDTRTSAPRAYACRAWHTTSRGRARAPTARNMLGLLLIVGIGVGVEEPDSADLDDRRSYSLFQAWFAPAYRKTERCIVMDIGANDGSWTKSVQKLTKEVKHKKARNQTEFHLFEPQPRFAEPLRLVTDDWPHSHIYQAAAWKDDTKNLTFFLSRTSVSASLEPVMAYHSGVPRRGPSNITVRTVDIGAFMQRLLPPVPDALATLVVVKLDVESAEFELLPYLLASGVLCRAHIFIIEWHLNALPPEDRLAGLGLRLTLSAMLRRGCTALLGRKHARWAGRRLGPRVVHEGAPINNWEQEVPGLWQVALFHNGTPVPGEAPSRQVKQWETTRVSIATGTHMKGHRPMDMPRGLLPGRR